MTVPLAGDPDVTGLAADRLHDIELVADAALSRLDERALLNALVERVKKALQADTAAVLLLDRPAGQLVATAASGIEEEVRQGVRIPLGAGFAGRIAATGEPVILDTVDHTTVRNPLLVDRGIRSLLGVPLFAGGHVIGVLHVGSLSGRRFGQQDVMLLQMAADRAAHALRSMMAQDDAQAAVALQRSLLPTALPVMPGLDLAARYVAGSGTVGGDWYDVFILQDGRLGMVVGDVAGSGLGAAVIPGNGRVRGFLGRPPPAGTGGIGRTSGPAFPPAGPPIGTADDPQRRTATFCIPPGSLLCCYTDGLVERRGQVLDQGIGAVAVTLGKLIAASPGGANAEEACIEVMRVLVGTDATQDDIAVLMLSRPAS